MKLSDLNYYEQREYRTLRQKGLGARLALVIASRDHGGPDVPTDHGDQWEQEGFDLRLEIEGDDLSLGDVGLGHYTSTWQEGCLDLKREGYRVERGQHPYFLPDMTLADHMASGSSYKDSLLYVRQVLARAESFCQGEWHYQRVLVTVSREGIELASASLGGLESDCGLRYLRETIADLAEEAIQEAKGALESLCTCEGEQ